MKHCTVLLPLILLVGCAACSTSAQSAKPPISSVETTAKRASINIEVPSTSTPIPSTGAQNPTVTTHTPDITKPEKTTAPAATDSPSTVMNPSVSNEPTVTTPKLPTTADPDGTKTPIGTTKPPETIQPEQNDPIVTKPPVTTANPPEPEKPPVHTHSFSAWKTIKAATCTTDGTQIRTCSCGTVESRSIPATGHSWSNWTVTKAPTEQTEGEEARTCPVCGKKEIRSAPKLPHTHVFGEWELGDDFIHEIRTCPCGETERKTHYATPEDARLIADRVIYYVNKFRAEEGNIPAEKLERLTLVAEYRSKQIVTNFSHDNNDTKEAYTVYQYGEHIVGEETRLDIETGKIIYTGNILDYYSAHGAGEAIGYDPIDFSHTKYSTIDRVAYWIAHGYRDSAGHWRYVGSSDYPYIAVGITFATPSDYNGEDFGRWYSCIKVIDTTQYE